MATDFELWVRFFRHAELYSVDIPLAAFRYRHGQRSQVFRETYEAEAFKVLRQEFERLDPIFRQTYAALLPERPTTLSEEAVMRMDRALSVRDPVTITRAALSNHRTNSSKITAAAAHPEKLSQSVFAVDDLTELEDIHVGETSFIFSHLSDIRPNIIQLLENEVVFVSDDAIDQFERFSRPPTYFACFDREALFQRRASIDETLFENLGVTAFFPAQLESNLSLEKKVPVRTIIPPGPGRYFVGKMTAREDKTFETLAAQVKISSMMGCQQAVIVCDERESEALSGIAKLAKQLCEDLDMHLKFVTSQELVESELLRDRNRARWPRQNTMAKLLKSRALSRGKVRAPMGRSAEVAPRAGSKWYSSSAHRLGVWFPKLFLFLQTLRRRLTGNRMK
ncbi:MAG: hypothetical protein AAGJ68_01350 [Pseudomonadota bacterium]